MEHVPEFVLWLLDHDLGREMTLLSGKRQKVENPDGGGASLGAQSGAQPGSTEIADSSNETPEKQTRGAGGNEGAGATTLQCA